MIGFVSKEDALAAGLTHEGTICGVPCWMIEDEDGNASGAPKFVPAQLWISLCDKLYNFATVFMSREHYIEFPMKVKNKIA